MNIEEISGNNIELTTSIEDYARKRIQKLAKIVQNQKPATMRVEVGKPSSQYRKGADVFYTDLTAQIQDKQFRVRKSDSSVYKAIEKARVDMHQQILKWKKKERSVQRKMGMLAKEILRSGHDFE